MEEEKLLFSIDDLETKEPLQITFSEPLEPPFGEVFSEALENFQEEPIPYEISLPYATVDEAKELYIEIPVEPLPVEVFVHKQASYGLLDGKYLIRY